MKEIVEAYLKMFSESETTNTKPFLTNVASYVSGTKPIYEFTKDDFEKMFEELSLVKEISGFRKYKSMLKAFMFWCAKSGVYQFEEKELAEKAIHELEYVQFESFDKSDAASTHLFKDNESFMKMLDRIEDMKFYTAKIVAILYWLGYGLEEMTYLKRFDLDSETCTLEGFKVDKVIFDELYEYAFTTVITYNKSNNIPVDMYLHDTPYILRRADSYANKDSVSDNVVSTNTIKVHSSRFKSEIKRMNIASKSFHMKDLVWNGLFVRLKMYEDTYGVNLFDENADFDRLSKAVKLNIDIGVATKRRLLLNYKRWKRNYFGYTIGDKNF